MSNRTPRGKGRAPRSTSVPPAPIPRSSSRTPVKPGVSTATSAIPVVGQNDKKTWAFYNSKVSDQDRVIAVKNPEGRYCHPACADKLQILKPTSRPAPPKVHARMATKVASSGGMLCVICNTFIVPPANTRGIERARAMWEKANAAYLKGEITEAQWLEAAKRFASSRVDEA